METNVAKFPVSKTRKARRAAVRVSVRMARRIRLQHGTAMLLGVVAARRCGAALQNINHN